MNRERMLGVFNNLLQEMAEHQIINDEGINAVMRSLLNNTTTAYSKCMCHKKGLN